jgi:integrase
MAVFQKRDKWKVEIWKKGKRVYTKGGFLTELDAKNHEAEILEDLPTNTGFTRLVESRLEELEDRRSEKHFNENLTLLKNLTQRWGRKKVVTRQDVEDYLREVFLSVKSRPNEPEEKRKLRAGVRANKRLRLLKALWNHGIKKGWIKNNPCLGIERYPQGSDSRYIPPIEDLKLVLEVAEAPGCMDKFYLLTLIHTLGRMREVNRLKWDDVDYDRGFVTLYTRKAKCSDLKPTRVPMNEDLRKVLKKIPRTSDYVFTNPKTETAYDHRDKMLHTLCKLAGVKEFTYHCLRHFGASTLDELGVSLTSIQSILGHERPTTTDNYLQSLRGSRDTAIKKLEGIV